MFTFLFPGDEDDDNYLDSSEDELEDANFTDVTANDESGDGKFFSSDQIPQYFALGCSN